MKISDLIHIMEGNGIGLPKEGTGRGGKIIARDLETAIGDFYVEKHYPAGTPERKHVDLRRQWTPMKAYRFSNLNASLQSSVFDDDNGWIAERKLNGWRMMITFVPGTTPMFWGGNLSTVNFLPVNYTKHVMLNKDGEKHPATSELFKLSQEYTSFILDSEVLVRDKEEDLSEHASLIQVQEILGSSPDRARLLQTKATLIFKLFDYIDPKQPRLGTLTRKDLLLGKAGLMKYEGLDQFSMIPYYAKGKKAHVNNIWREGGEGIILKQVHAPYTPGSRLRTHQIKVKRTHSDSVGADIDAYVTNVFSTPEWAKKGMIGGIELSVNIDDGTHVIAHVSSMPDSVRADITINKEDWMNRVLVVDGMDLSARNRLLLHAKVDWERGVRVDKSPMDCTLDIKVIEGVKF